MENFVVGAPADAEVGGLGPGFSGSGVGWGARGYGGAGAVREEERVGLDVGNELVEAGGGIGERAGGEQGLNCRGQRVCDEGPGLAGLAEAWDAGRLFLVVVMDKGFAEGLTSEGGGWSEEEELRWRFHFAE